MAKIVITGGSGLLGRALIARLHHEMELTVFSRSEKAQLPLRAAYRNVRFLLGDVLDAAFVDRVMEGQDGVIHAAALKHVDLSEAEPSVYAKVNVIGSLHVAEAAAKHGVRAVGISTDKACDPVNVYGFTKALMEHIFTEHGHVSVRYGNVFGSDGSVLQRWQRQVEESGTITVTDPEMTRFFFQIADAVEVVVWALRSAPAGSVIVPRLGAVNLMDLANAFVDQAGRGSINVIGPRAGEKRDETLLSAAEGVQAHPVGDGYVAILRNGDRDAQPAIPMIQSATADRIPMQELRSWLS